MLWTAPHPASECHERLASLRGGESRQDLGSGGECDEQDGSLERLRS
jgi:hypothetical protein